MSWFIGALKKYATFSGRARRKEYWMFVLFYFLFAIAIGFVESMLGIAGTISGLYGLALLLPGLAVGARRLHDTDRSGWWLLISLIPAIGTIVLIIFFCIDGTPGSNRFGSNPKETAT